MVARLAAEQEGVVDLDELRVCGLTREAVSARVRNGRLHPKHRGVYAVGHPSISLTGRFIAAVKASGPGAALSHRAAAALWGFYEWNDRDIEVTIPAGARRRHAGIHVHRSALLTRADCSVRDGLLVTNPAWTLVALAAVVPPPALRAAIREALGLRLVSLRQLVDVHRRVGPGRGSRALAEILARGAVPTRSELEDVVFDLIIAAGFEPPEVNAPLRIGGRTVIPDFRWPQQHVVLEADGARWHDHALARADDGERQALLEARGETVVRVNWLQAVAGAAKVCERLDAAGAPRPNPPRAEPLSSEA